MKDECPCRSNTAYMDCCGVYHSNAANPDTAEQLMRSRYSAYALKLVNYLVETTHRDKLKSSYRRALVATIHDIEWTNLLVTKISAGGLSDKAGKVKFEARYIENGENGVMHEYSRFRKLAGKWYYYDGKSGFSKEKRSDGVD